VSLLRLSCTTGSLSGVLLLSARRSVWRPFRSYRPGVKGRWRLLLSR